MKIKMVRVNPAGNITIFVMSPVPTEQRTELASKIMALTELHVEQVGFLCPPAQGSQGRMEMAGGEFCGNATRAFGMLLAQQQGSNQPIQVEVSGCDHPVMVDVDMEEGTARSEMPLPLWTKAVEINGAKGTLVHLGGIAHLVVENVTPNQDFFDGAEPIFSDIPGLDAYGVIFLEPETSKMTPLVKVPASNTMIWEGSCGSGSLACVVAQSETTPDGTVTHQYIQPAGVVEATVERQGGKVVSAYIGGPVLLDEPMEIEL